MSRPVAGIVINISYGVFAGPHDGTASLEQEFEVWIRISAITRKTIRYTSELARGETKIATGTHTVACVRTRPNEPMRSTTIPPEIAERFQVAPGADL